MASLGNTALLLLSQQIRDRRIVLPLLSPEKQEEINHDGGQQFRVQVSVLALWRVIWHGVLNLRHRPCARRDCTRKLDHPTSRNSSNKHGLSRSVRNRRAIMSRGIFGSHLGHCLSQLRSHGWYATGYLAAGCRWPVPLRPQSSVFREHPAGGRNGSSGKPY